MVDTNEQTLQRAAQRTHNLDLQGAARKVTGLKRDLNGICKSLWGQEVNESFDDLLMLVGNHTFQPVFGGAGTLGTPDHASFAITDIDARWLGTFRTPGVSYQLIGQWPAIPNQSWVLSIHPNKAGRLAVSSDGTAIDGNEATAPYPFVDNKVYWIRQTILNSGGNRTRTYYWAPPTSTGVPTVWTQVGDPVVQTGTIVPFNTTGDMRINWLGFIGADRFYAAEVRNGINGTIVCNPDVRKATALGGAGTTVTDSTGKVWTVSGFGRIV